MFLNESIFWHEKPCRKTPSQITQIILLQSSVGNAGAAPPAPGSQGNHDNQVLSNKGTGDWWDFGIPGYRVWHDA